MDSVTSSSTRVNNLLYRVYGWMTLALILTALTAYIIATHTAWLNALVTKPWIGLTLLVVQLIVAISFATLLPRISYTQALLLFILYACISGATLSVIFRVYSIPSIIEALGVTAAMFAFAALYGYATKRDLSGLGSFLRMALWGFVIALVINMFLQSGTFNLIMSCIGVVLFTALTAYDVAMIKQYAARMENTDSESYAKAGLYCAFQLYLDFVNLFLSLLNITGRRRD